MAAPPVTTLFPLAQLPSCAANCGVLYDVNGKCVPPNVQTAAASVYASCFCGDSRLSPFTTGATGICTAACAADADQSSVQGWFTSFCGNIAAVGDNTQTSESTTTSPTAKAGQGSGSGGGGGTWLDNHYQWVIFLVIMIVAIVGIWVGACVWRRRYLRRKDRAYALGTNLAHTTPSGRVAPNDSNAGSVHVPQPGMFDPAPISTAGVYGEKAAEQPAGSKKKWLVRGDRS